MGVRSALLLFFRRVARVYFREIEVAGDVPRADTHGRLFGANHVNGLVDPILVLTQTPCPISPVAKSTLWKIPGLKWLLDAVGAVPIVRRRDVPGKSESDNEAVFARVASHLVAGGNILIFPEGTSHNEPHLLPLRTGAGRMLARAGTEPGGDALTFQAVALEFDDREVFRSRSLVLFGPVRRVADLPGETDVAAEITKVLEADLSELLVEGSTWEERVLVVRVAEMFAKDVGDVSLEHLNRVGRRIEQARRVLARAAPEEVRAIEERLRAYVDRLDREETSDDVVAGVARGKGGDLEAARVTRAAAMIATLPLALLAVVLYWLPYQVPRLVTRRLKGTRDETSTFKLGVGLLVFPIWAALAIVLASLRLPTELAVVATALVLTSPFAALAWLDRWDRLASRSGMLAPSEERREQLELLAAERSRLMKDLEALGERAETPSAT